MALNPNIILQGRGIDLVGSIDRGAVAGQRARLMGEQNALNGFVRQNGQAIMSGDQNALNGLAGMGTAGLEMAQGTVDTNLNRESTRLGMDATRQGMQLAQAREARLTRQEQAEVQRQAAAMTAAQRQAEAQQLEGAVAMGLSLPDAATWDAVMAEEQPELVGQFPMRENLAAKMLGVADALKRHDQMNAPVDPIDQIALERAQVGLEADRLSLDEARNPTPEVIDAAGLRKEWNGNASVKAFATQATAFGRIKAAAENPSPAGDMALIFNFMKVLDPGSVVRESEYATAANAAAVPDQVRNMYNRVLSGERLSPQQRDDFVGRSQALYQSAEAEYSSLYDQFSAIAGRAGIRAEDAIVDYRFVGGNSTSPQGGTNTPPPAPTAGGSTGSIDFSAIGASDILGMDLNQMNEADLKAYMARMDELGL